MFGTGVIIPVCFLQINKQNEQMHGLLAIALTMYPMRIDESIHTQLREKYGDKMLRMQKGYDLHSLPCFTTYLFKLCVSPFLFYCYDFVLCRILYKVWSFAYGIWNQ